MALSQFYAQQCRLGLNSRSYFKRNKALIMKMAIIISACVGTEVKENARFLANIEINCISSNRSNKRRYTLHRITLPVCILKYKLKGLNEMLKERENVLSLFQAELQIFYKYIVSLILLQICSQKVH